MLTLDEFINPFEIQGSWYKANLHTHTTTSDGAFGVAEIVDKYKTNGYAVLAITDHEKTNDISGYSDRTDILVVGGMECHPVCPSHGGSRPAYHIVAVNVPKDFSYDKKNANKCVEQISRAGGVAILAHPFWSGHNMIEMATVCGVSAIEIYNSAGDPLEESSNEWMLYMGHGYYFGGIACDDTHSKEMRDMFGGWTWLKMKSISVENVVKALKTGAYYASSGPEIKDFRVENNTIKISCSPVTKIALVGLSHGQGYVSWADENGAFSSIEVPLESVRSRPFIRAIVSDSCGKKAWTNPLDVSKYELKSV